MPRIVASWPTWLIHLLVPILALLPVLWALLPGGLPNSADGMVHFARIIEIVLSWRDGIYLPRWSLNLGFGYGIPVFVFGPPLSYLLGAFYNTVGLGPEAAYKAMLVTALLIGAIGAYRLGQLLLGMAAGAVAAVAFIYAPNQLFTLFVQGNAPQLLAWSFLPWALWATVQIYLAQETRARWGYALALALAVSSTLISHNVVSLILGPTVGALVILLWFATRDLRALGCAVAGGALGGMMGAWFAVPALLETVYASTERIFVADFRTFFVPVAELLAWPSRIDAGAINPYIPRTLGMPVVIVALIGVFVLGARWLTRQSPAQPFSGEQKTARVFWAVALFMFLYALICAWMATRASLLLWEQLPILAFLQFPARWIGFAGVALAWLAAAAVGVAVRRVQPVLAGVICFCLLASALVNLYPDKTPPGTRTLAVYEVVDYEVSSGAIGTTSYGEFNPRWAPKPLPLSSMVDDYLAQRPVDRLEGRLPQDATYRSLKVTAHEQRYEIILTSPATVSVNLLYFPGWSARVNDMPVQLWPDAVSGLVTVALPTGKSVLDLRFGPTRLRRAMGLLSTAAWGVFAVALAAIAVGTLRRGRTRPLPEHSGVAQLGLALSAAVGVTILLHSVGSAWLQLRSPVDHATAATVPRHEDVGERFRLIGQEPLPETVEAGENLPVVAYWRALVELDENYAAVLRMVEVVGGQTLIEVEQTHPNNIPTSGWATGLHLRNEWQVAIPADALPLQYAIRVTFRHPQSGELLPDETGGTGVELGRLWVLSKEEPEPPDGPRAQFGASIELLGAASDGQGLTLYWRANAPINEEYTIFVHLLDANGQLLGQLDGLPFANRYATWAWRPGQIIEDRHELAAAGVDPARIARVAVGVYQPDTGERLAAMDEQGQPLPDNAYSTNWNR